jgi:hypothetical protein
MNWFAGGDPLIACSQRAGPYGLYVRFQMR